MAAFDSLCQALEENRIDTANVYTWGLGLTDERAQRLGRALRGNTAVQILHIDIYHLTLAGTSSLSRFVSSSPSLSKVLLTDVFGEENPSVQRRLARMAAANALLAAVSLNERIHDLEHSTLFDAHSLTSCIRGKKSSLVALKLNFCSGNILAENINEEDAEMLGMAVASLESLEVFSLDCQCNNFTVSFLARLGEVLPKLRSFSIFLRGSEAPNNVFSRALQNTLTAADRLEELGLNLNQDWEGQDEFVGDVLEGLHRHETLHYLHSDFRFGGEAFSRVANLLGPDNVLEKLMVDCKDMAGLCGVLEAVGTSTTLKRLEVCVDLEDNELFEQGLQRFGSLLPEITSVKELEIFLSFDNVPPVEMIPDANEALEALVRGFELNTSLIDVYVDFGNIFDVALQPAINFYATRNKFGPALESASKAKMLTIFEKMEQEEEERLEDSILSVVFDTLRGRSDWYE